MFARLTKQIKRDQFGLSLLELLLYVAIASMILMGVTGFVRVLLEAQVRNEVVARVEESAARILPNITNDIRNADAVLLPAAGATGTELELDTAAGTVRYYVEDGVLLHSTAAGEEIFSSAMVRVVQFQVEHVANGVIVLDVSISYDSTSDRAVYDYSETFHTTVKVRKPQSSP